MAAYKKSCNGKQMDKETLHKFKKFASNHSDFLAFCDENKIEVNETLIKNICNMEITNLWKHYQQQASNGHFNWKYNKRMTLQHDSNVQKFVNSASTDNAIKIFEKISKVNKETEGNQNVNAESVEFKLRGKEYGHKDSRYDYVDGFKPIDFSSKFDKDELNGETFEEPPIKPLNPKVEEETSLAVPTAQDKEEDEPTPQKSKGTPPKKVIESMPYDTTTEV